MPDYNAIINFWSKNSEELLELQITTTRPTS